MADKYAYTHCFSLPTENSYTIIINTTQTPTLDTSQARDRGGPISSGSGNFGDTADSSDHCGLHLR